VRWKCVHKEFSCESPGERILKIGPRLPKLLSNIKGLRFLEHGDTSLFAQKVQQARKQTIKKQQQTNINKADRY